VPIPPDEACRFLADEMTWGGMADCEIIAGDGPWHSAGNESPSAIAVSSQ